MRFRIFTNERHGWRLHGAPEICESVKIRANPWPILLCADLPRLLRDPQVRLDGLEAGEFLLRLFV